MKSIAKKILAIALVCCMTTTLLPTSALAALPGVAYADTSASRTEENTDIIESADVESTIDAYTSSHTDETTLDGVSTSVSVRTLSEFRWVRWTGPEQNVTLNDVADPNKASGKIVIEYEKGAPKKLENNSLGYEYSLEVTRKAFKSDGTPQTSGTTKVLSGGYVEDSSANPTVSIEIARALEEFTEEIIGSADPSYFYGSYDFNVVTSGASASPVCTVNFWIVPDNFLKDRINADDANPDNLYMMGSFISYATLEAKDIKQDVQNPTFAALQNEAKDYIIDTAYQLDITNGTLFNTDELYKQVDTITLPVSKDLADRAQDTLVVLAIVDGQVKRVEYKRTSNTNEYVNVSDSTDKLNFIPASDTEDTSHVTFCAKNLGLGPGAFAVSYKSTDTFGVTTHVSGGIIDSAQNARFALGATPTFYFSPYENFYLASLDDIEVEGLSPSQYTLAQNYITLLDTSSATNVVINVRFSEYTKSDADSDISWKLDVDVSFDSGGFGEVSVDTCVLDANKLPTQSDTNKFSGHKSFDEVCAGKSVYLSFFAGEGSYLKSLKINGVDVGISSATYTIATMHENTSVEVVFAPGAPSVNLTYTISGKIALGEGNFGYRIDDAGLEVPITEYSTKVSAGSFQHININASQGYVIDKATLDGVPITEAAGRDTYTLTIFDVRSNHEIVVSFVADKVEISIPSNVVGATITTNMSGTSPYSVSVGEKVEVYISPLDSYTLGKVVIGDVEYTLDELTLGKDGYLLVQNSSGTYTLSFDAKTSVSVLPVLFPKTDPTIPQNLKTLDIVAHGGCVIPTGKHTLYATGGAITLNFSKLASDEYRDTHVDKIEIASNTGETKTVLFSDLEDVWSWEFRADDWSGTTFAIDVYFTLPGSGEVISEPSKADIVIATNTGGTIDPLGVKNSSGEWVYEGVNCNTKQTFALISDEGYELSCVWLSDESGKLVDVLGKTYKDKDGQDIPYVSNNTFSFIPTEFASSKSVYKVYVEFKKIDTQDPDQTQKLLVTRLDSTGSGQGDISPLGSSWVSTSSKQNISIIPANDSKIASVLAFDLDDEGNVIEGTSRVLTSIASSGILPITLDKNTLVLVKFDKAGPGDIVPVEKKIVEVVSGANTGGTISPAGTQTLLVGSTLSFSIKAQEGYDFLSISLKGEAENDTYETQISSTDSRIEVNEFGDTYTYTLPSDLIERFAKTTEQNTTGRICVIANFKAQSSQEKTCHVTTRVTGPANAGYISPGMCEGQAGIDVVCGTSQTFSFINADGYVVRAVYVDGIQVAANVSTYTLENITSDTDLCVEFEVKSTHVRPDTHKVVSSVLGDRGGSISPSGTTDVIDGANIAFSFIPDAGWRIKDVLVDNKSVISDVSLGTLELFGISSDRYVVVEYESVVVDTTLTLLEAKGPGRISPSGVIDLTKTANTSFTFIPNNPSSDVKVIDLTSITVDVYLEDGSIKTFGGQDLSRAAKQNDWTLDIDTIKQYISNQGYTFDRISYIQAVFAEVDKQGPSGPTIGDGEEPPVQDKRINIETFASYGGVISPVVYEGVVPSSANKTNDYTFVVKPISGYHTEDVYIDTPSISGVNLIDNGDNTFTLKVASTSNAGGMTVRVCATFTKNEAQVTRDEYTLEIAVQGPGYINPGNISQQTGKKLVKVPAQGSYALSLFPDEGYKAYIKVGQTSIFDASDTSDLRSVGQSYFLSNIASDMSVLVVFEPLEDKDQTTHYETFTINSKTLGSGKIEPLGDTLVNAGSNLVFTLSPDKGYKLSYLAIDAKTDQSGNIVSAQYVSAHDIKHNQYVFTNIGENHSIVAVFVDEDSASETFTTYDLGLGKTDRGYVVPSGNVLIKEGDVQTATINPYHGFCIKQAYFIDNAGSRIGSIYTPNAGKTSLDVPLSYRGEGQYRLVVDFDVDPLANTGGEDIEIDESLSYVIKASVDGKGGKISPSGTQIIRANTSQTFTLIADPGYKVSSAYTIDEAGNKVALFVDGNSFTLREISKNMEVFAHFEALEQGEEAPVYTNHLVNVFSEGPGQVYPSGSVVISHGKPLTLTFEPNEKARLKRLFVEDGLGRRDITSDVVGLSYTISSSVSNLDFTVEFESTGDISSFEEYANVYTNIHLQNAADTSFESVGYISPSFARILKGTSAKFYILPDDGYEVVSATLTSKNKTSTCAVLNVDGSVFDGTHSPLQPYKYVAIDSVDEDAHLDVVLRRCESGVCTYDKKSLVKLDINTSGSVAILPFEDIYIAPNDSVNIVAIPTKGEEITEIQIGDSRFVVPNIAEGTNDEDKTKIIQSATEEFNKQNPGYNLRYNPDDKSYSFDIEADSLGTTPKVYISATGNVSDNTYYFDSLANIKTSADGGYLIVTRTVDGKTYQQITQAGKDIPVSVGQEIVVEAIANAGYKLGDITSSGFENIDSQTRSANTTNRYRVVGSNPTLIYSFEKIQDSSSSSSGTNGGDGNEESQTYQITSSSKGHGEISPYGTVVYKLGEDAEYNFIADTGYVVSSVVLDGKEISYSSDKFIYKGQDEKAGSKHTLEVVFRPTVLSGTGDKLVRVPSTIGSALSQLAKTGDISAALVCALLAIASASCAVAIFTTTKTKRRKAKE